MQKETIIKKIYRAGRSLFFDPALANINNARQRRLLIGKAQWRGNAKSPVCLTIDDFANAWFDANGNGLIDPGEDWGGGLDQPNSAVTFLQKKLLNLYPEVCITYFTVMGPISSFCAASPFTSSKAINDSSESQSFFKKIHFQKNYEIAYHGYDHGTPGDNQQPFFQEWENISSEESLQKINRGAKIYEQVFGHKPLGGKTGAYIMNRGIEESIDTYGFNWWCRDWTHKNVANNKNNLPFEPKFFGSNKVIDLPSTINGRIWFKRQIKNLLQAGQVITIQEHISPHGAGTRHIRPNIFEDISSLQKIYKYLRGKNVWHATLNEIAEYIDARTYTQLYDATAESFQIDYSGKLTKPVITLLIDPYNLHKNLQAGYLAIRLPDGSLVAGQQYHYNASLGLYIVDLPVQNGKYLVTWEKSPVPELSAKADSSGKIQYSHLGFTGELKINLPDTTDRIFRYKNNNRETFAQHLPENKVTVNCINSSPDDQLI